MNSLTCDLTVKNVDSFGSAPVPFQALLHTYFAAAASKVAVEGFNGCEYLDKVLDKVTTQYFTPPHQHSSLHQLHSPLHITTHYCIHTTTHFCILHNRYCI
jgi:D-hexose-6-phosphate mutarotase